MNRRFFSILIIFLTFLCFSCKKNYDSKSEQSLKNQLLDNSKYLSEIKLKKQNSLNDFIKNLTLEEKISQLFVINIDGNKNFKPIEKFVPGGYLFFSYNLDETPEKIIEFTDSIKKYASENKIIPPFLSIDQEGGFVNRLRGISGPLPSASRISECLSVEDSYKLYSMQAKQMKILGFDLNFAPVVEILTTKNEKFLNGRSFGSENQVISYGRAALNAFENNGIACVLKHFPGNTNVDPHSGLPEIDLEIEELQKSLISFKELISYSPTAVLMSHARTKSVDSKNPSCFSEEWIQKILISDFKFEGIVFSDDIFMGALSKNGFLPEKAVILAVEAGINCIMISEKRFENSLTVLKNQAEKDSRFLQKINNSVRKIINFKIKNGILDFETVNGELKLIPAKKTESVENRVEKFNKIKKENVDFYWKNFDPQ